MKRILIVGLVLGGFSAVIPRAEAAITSGFHFAELGAAAEPHENGLLATLGVKRERGLVDPTHSPRPPSSSCGGSSGRSCRSVG